VPSDFASGELVHRTHAGDKVQGERLSEYSDSFSNLDLSDDEDADDPQTRFAI